MIIRSLLISIILLQLASCTSTLNRLQKLGSDIPVNKTDLPQNKENYQPLKWHHPKAVCDKGTANSLWRGSNRTFFKDSRARNVGDIIKVKIKINDKATLNNKTTKQRKSNENLALPKLFGIQNRIFPDTEKDFSLLDLKGGNNNSGEGKIDRTETIDTEIAAMVTQILPNGNMVVMGSQEIKINFEIRQLSIQGIVRAEDVSIENIVESDKIAELRVTYGGQGDLSEVQRPRLGTQLIDILSPF